MCSKHTFTPCHALIEVLHRSDERGQERSGNKRSSEERGGKKEQSTEEREEESKGFLHPVMFDRFRFLRRRHLCEPSSYKDKRRSRGGETSAACQRRRADGGVKKRRGRGEEGLQCLTGLKSTAGRRRGKGRESYTVTLLGNPTGGKE